MSEHLHHKLAVLQQNLSHGKLPRDVVWEDAVGLVEHLGRVETHGNEEFTFLIGDLGVPFKKPHSHHMELEDVSKLRKLLHAAAPAAATTRAGDKCRMIVVIDHHVAHIYEDVGSHRPVATDNITPADPHHFHHHLIHKKEAHYQGDRVPEDSAFYAAVADALVPAHQIMVIGHGVGKSNAGHFLMDYLTAHRPQIAKSVQAQEAADLSALTEPQIEALAKQHLPAAVPG